jgi:hypothetical protein
MQGGKFSFVAYCKIDSAYPVNFGFWILQWLPCRSKLRVNPRQILSKQEVIGINSTPSGQVATTQPKKVLGPQYYPETLESVIEFLPNLEKLEWVYVAPFFSLGGAFSLPLRPLLPTRGILYHTSFPPDFTFRLHWSFHIFHQSFHRSSLHRFSGSSFTYRSHRYHRSPHKGSFIPHPSLLIPLIAIPICFSLLARSTLSVPLDCSNSSFSFCD